jgi:hypothetical protein
MVVTNRKTVSPAYVQAPICFGRRDVDGTLLAEDIKSLSALEQHVINISDGRSTNQQPTLAANGLLLDRHTTEVVDFFDREAVKELYANEMCELIGKTLRADKVLILETLIRGSKELAANRPKTRVDEYAFKAHVDADGESFLRWANIMNPEESQRYKNRPFAVYNVWRPLVPVEEKPLALCDASTVTRDDLVPAFYSGFEGLATARNLDYPPPVHYFHLAFNPNQRWFYFPNMTPDEVLIFKQWDSNEERPLCVPHTAFDDPNTRKNARPRSNIEARAIAFF